MKILNYYPKVTAKTASTLNFAASTTAGLIYLFTAANLNTLEPVLMSALLIAGMFIDSATVPYVHSGIISRRYKAMKYSDLYMKIHVPPAMIGYGLMMLFIVSLFTIRLDLLFYLFAACWSVVYASGVYGYIKVTF